MLGLLRETHFAEARRGLPTTMTMAPDRKVLVTGGASGFGLDIARRLHRAGARVALLDVNRESLDRASQDLAGALIVEADVRSIRDLRSAVTAAAGALDGLDTVVISAGVIHCKSLDEVSEADWDLTMDVNLKGAFFTVQAASEYLVASGRGRVVTISSDAGRRDSRWNKPIARPSSG